MLRVTMCAALFLYGLAAPAAADVRYRLTDLGDLTSDGIHGATTAAGVSDNGQVVGRSFNDALQGRAFIRRDGSMADLGDFPGLTSAPQASAVNRKSQFVGSSVLASGQTRAFLWAGGALQDLGTLHGSGGDTYAWGINNHGDIVGAGYSAAGELRALRWNDGALTELGSLPDGRAAVQAFGINDHGEIVGYLSPGGEVSFARAFIWRKGDFIDLGTLPQTDLSFANAVNDRGQVVGQSYNTAIPGAARAFVWERGAMLDLGMPAPTHTFSDARAINKKGIVVGTSGIGAAETAWIWSDGVIRDLNTLLVDDPNYPHVHLVVATGINDRGEISAQGYDDRLGGSIRGYLLTPNKNLLDWLGDLPLLSLLDD